MVRVLFLRPLVLARGAEVQGDDGGSGTLSQTSSKMLEPTTLFQSRIRVKISLPSCFRTELGLSVARRS